MNGIGSHKVAVFFYVLYPLFLIENTWPLFN